MKDAKMSLQQITKRAEQLYSEMSPADKSILSVSVIAYGLQKICPDIFFANLANEYEAKRTDGATAISSAYRRLAKNCFQK